MAGGPGRYAGPSSDIGARREAIRNSVAEPGADGLRASMLGMFGSAHSRLGTLVLVTGDMSVALLHRQCE